MRTRCALQLFLVMHAIFLIATVSATRATRRLSKESTGGATRTGGAGARIGTAAAVAALGRISPNGRRYLVIAPVGDPDHSQHENSWMDNKASRSWCVRGLLPAALIKVVLALGGLALPCPQQLPCLLFQGSYRTLLWTRPHVCLF